MRILLVEDDPLLGDGLRAGLRQLGFQVDWVRDGIAAERELRSDAYAATVLDLGLPMQDGMDVLAHVRAAGVTLPVLVLTARDAVPDRVRGLDAGADDYLTKTFAFRELVARVRALARRPPTTLAETIVIDDLAVDIPGHRVRRGRRDIELTAKEFALLECLVRHRGRVVDRATITAHVWDDNHDPFTNVLEVLVRRLRRKIDDGFDVKLIHTLRGAGYRLGA